MTIKQLLNNPIQRVGGFDVTVKTCKKLWKVKETWFHQTVLMDETGEMLADFKVVKYQPLIRGETIRVVVSETRDTDKGRILYVDQFVRATATEPDYIPNFKDREQQIARSKTKCRLVASGIQAGQIKIGGLGINGLDGEVCKAVVDKLVNYIME